jgi:hypothetical protein
MIKRFNNLKDVYFLMEGIMTIFISASEIGRGFKRDTISTKEMIVVYLFVSIIS